jgi:hypothetical protein
MKPVKRAAVDIHSEMARGGDRIKGKTFIERSVFLRWEA